MAKVDRLTDAHETIAHVLWNTEMLDKGCRRPEACVEVLRTLSSTHGCGFCVTFNVMRLVWNGASSVKGHEERDVFVAFVYVVVRKAPIPLGRCLVRLVFAIEFNCRSTSPVFVRLQQYVDSIYLFKGMAPFGGASQNRRTRCVMALEITEPVYTAPCPFSSLFPRTLNLMSV